MSGYRGRRRLVASRGAVVQRVLLAGLAAGLVLFGSGALAASLPLAPFQSARQPAPATHQPAPEISFATPPVAAPPAAPTGPGQPTSPAYPSAPATASPPTAAPSPSPTPAEATTSYEAENAELSGFVRIFPLPDASGGAVVGMIGQHPDSYVEFPSVLVDEPGEYEVTFYYVSPRDSEADVRVNGGEPVTVSFPGLSAGREIGEVSLTVELASGDNELWFGNPEERAPSLDRIRVVPS